MFYVCAASTLAGLGQCHWSLLSLMVALPYDLYCKSNLKDMTSGIIVTAYLISFTFIKALSFFSTEHLESSAMSLFIASLCVYHFAEFIVTAYYHPEAVSWNSEIYAGFLINHSKEYGFAIAIALVEGFVKMKLGFMPNIIAKMCLYFGGCLAVIGHIFRIGSEVTAGANFTHVISSNQKPNHVLVTWGVYSLCRHPGYFGWAIWSIGTQVMLCNPISVCLYVYASKVFFSERVE